MHPSQPDLIRAILSALVEAGRDPDHLQPGELAALDEVHIRGKQATSELARQLDLQVSHQVLDVGCGVGGAARYLASAFGCQVVGLDLSKAYLQAARMLTERMGLSQKVRFLQGSAPDLPFQDSTFDVVWTQHATMSVADKPRLYSEMGRVLKAGGKLALYDVLAGPVSPVWYPTVWAQEAESSFLLTPNDLRSQLQPAGFHLLSWRDTTGLGREAFDKLVAKVKQNGLPPLGVHLLMGPDFITVIENQARNLNENRLVLIEAIAQKIG